MGNFQSYMEQQVDYSTSCIPRLPADLEYLIFRSVAMNQPDSIPNLLLVCRRVEYWLEDVRYRTLIIRSSTPRKFLERLSSKSPEFLATHVSRLWINSTDHAWWNELKVILYLCTGITHLVLVQSQYELPLDLSHFPRLHSLVFIPNQMYSLERDTSKISRANNENVTPIDWDTMGLSRQLKSLLDQVPVLKHVMVISPNNDFSWKLLLELESWRGLRRKITVAISSTLSTPSPDGPWHINPRQPHARVIHRFDFQNETEKVIWVGSGNLSCLKDWKTRLLGRDDLWSDLRVLSEEVEHSRSLEKLVAAFSEFKADF
ncbi:hypothetical protein DL96DRAFT_1733953 [Flagelloscypha sp. PMI_526]|nr:hypothetical protein DL96DRAFT_1733953 [Flagelloscypha sp. PMI_526]